MPHHKSITSWNWSRVAWMVLAGAIFGCVALETLKVYEFSGFRPLSIVLGLLLLQAATITLGVMCFRKAWSACFRRRAALGVLWLVAGMVVAYIGIVVIGPNQ